MDGERGLRLEAQAVLRRLGPLGADELAQHLREAGHAPDLAPSELWGLLLDEVDEDGQQAPFAAFPLDDGRLCDLDHLVDGLVLTREVTADERERGEVVLDGDLEAVLVLSHDGRHVPLAPGGELTVTRAGTLRGPAGWLPAAPVLILRATLDGVEVGGLDRVPEPDPVLADRLADVFATLDTGDRVVDAVELVVAARARYPKLLAEPAAPLGEVLAAGGLHVTPDGVVVVGDLWDDGDRWDDDELWDDDGWDDDPLVDSMVAHLLEDHGFDPAQVADVLVLHNAAQQAAVELLERLGDVFEDVLDGDALAVDELPAPGALAEGVGGLPVDDEDEVRGALERLLADAGTTVAVVHDGVGGDHLLATTTLALVDALGPQLDRRGRANRHWLRARLLEFVADDHTVVEPELRRALDLDPDHAEAIFDLARFRADRGEAGAALGLLRQLQASGGDPEWVALLEHYAQPGPTSAGRNDPCPCGSGRKHKVCCAARNGWPLRDRLEWVYDKTVRFAASAPAAELVEDVLAAVSDDLAEQFGSDVALTNLVMLESGLMEEFLDRKAGLLPADELELLHRFAETRAGAYEVVGVEPGQGVSLLDQGSGEQVEITDVSLSRDLAEGDLVLAWIAMGLDGPEPMAGVVPIPSQARASLLRLLEDDPDAATIAAWYDALHAPPRLTNAAGAGPDHGAGGDPGDVDL